MAPSKVLHTIEQHVLVDGFKIVIDLDKSRGSYLQNRVDNRRLIDFYGFFGSAPVGFNHPHFDDPQVQRDLLRAAKVKIANSDIYSAGYAEFVATFERVVGLPPLQRYLFIDGGALAVENCLKAAMDWKVRKNMAAGHGERGTQVLHFRRAFHGRQLQQTLAERGRIHAADAQLAVDHCAARGAGRIGGGDGHSLGPFMGAVLHN